MNSLIYNSSLGSFNLNGDGITLMQGHDFFNHKYDIERSLKLGGIGENLSRFKLTGKSYTFSLLINEDVSIKLPKLRAAFANDIELKKPGKLTLNGSYVECYLIESNLPTPKFYKGVEIIELKVLSLTPIWVTEKRFDFSIYHTESKESGFKLPMGFPTFFRSRYLVPYIENPNSSNNLSLITLYGPCKDPMISINDHVYGVFGELVENERFEIDQRNKTVQKITAAGDVINVFSDRVKSPSVFEPFPRGKHIVSYDRTFSVSITIFEGSVDATWN